MSDMPLPVIENPTPAASDSVTPDDVADVLMERVDTKVAQIEKEQLRFDPFKAALSEAEQTLATVQTSAQQTKDPGAQSVYERALAMAQHLIDAIKANGQAVMDRIAALQAELRELIQKLREVDPQNPLVSLA